MDTVTVEQLQELERLRQRWLQEPLPNCSDYIAALEAALWQQLPQPGVIGGFSWRLFGWEAAQQRGGEHE